MDDVAVWLAVEVDDVLVDVELLVLERLVNVELDVNVLDDTVFGLDVDVVDVLVDDVELDVDVLDDTRLEVVVEDVLVDIEKEVIVLLVSSHG